MLLSSREEIEEDFGALHTVSRIVGHSFDVLTTPERLALLERLEHETRRLRAPGHELINQIAEQSHSTELGGKLSAALARTDLGQARHRRDVAVERLADHHTKRLASAGQRIVLYAQHRGTADR